MTKQTGNCFARAYHDLVKDLECGRITKAAYDMMYQTLQELYKEKIAKFCTK